jgi:hypothetical protein
MSNISTIYDKLREQVALLFPLKLEIPNPYSLEDNAILFLKDSWGVTINEGSLGSINVYCLDAESRAFDIILVRQTWKVDGDKSPLVTDSKLLLEDARTLKNDMLAHDKLGTSSIQKIDFANSTGINFVKGDSFSLLTISLTFSIEYTENILNS